MGNVFNIRRLAGSVESSPVGGRVLPPLPFPYTSSGDVVKRVEDSYGDADEISTDTGEDAASFSQFGTAMTVPLSLRLADDEDWWLLPTEPLISLSGGSQMVRRYVAKARTDAGKRLRGSIKERWSTDDYTIQIEGLFTRHDEQSYPATDVDRLRNILEARVPVQVLCPLLNDRYGIMRIAVDKYDWPFTKGPENQAWRITAFSDDDWDLLIKTR
jgi:hypothetical protein